MKKSGSHCESALATIVCSKWGVMVRAEDAAAHHKRTQRSGGMRILQAPASQPYGER